MTNTDPRAVVIAMAFKQSLEINGGPGSSVNAHPNAFFLNVLGEVDLLKAGELALKRLAEYEERAAKAAALDIVK